MAVRGLAFLLRPVGPLDFRGFLHLGLAEHGQQHNPPFRSEPVGHPDVYRVQRDP